MSTSRFFVPLAVVAVIGCGSSPTSDRSGKGGELSGPLVLDPGAICFGPACLGRHVETLRLAPPAPPVIPSRPLGVTEPPPLPPQSLGPTAAAPSVQPVSGGKFVSAAAAVAPSPPPGCTSYSLDMQVLVIASDGQEADLQAIQQALGYHAVPYSTWIATQNAGLLTSDRLATGCAGHYQGVVLTTGNLVYSPDGGATWRSALTNAEWQALRSYEASFHVREISWFVNPGPDQGLNPPSARVDTSTTPIDALLTAAGQTAFPYVNASNPISISGVWVYLTTPADPNVRPLLVDRSGNALMSSRVTADGRETLALTFDSNPFLIHDLVLAHGLVEWVTNGIYLGEFRAYLTPQVDDLFIDDDMYFGGVFRMTDNDFNVAHSWQSGQQSRPGNAGFRLAFAFNGSGGVPEDPDVPADDPLTIAATTSNADFHFINHTFDHENLDNATYDFAFSQIDQNNAFAANQGFRNFTTANLVSPDVSGLGNADALQAAFDSGVRYMVSDTSQPGWSNPSPNIGIYSTIQPAILLIPRRPTNLFYNVSTPDEWMAEYNALYSSFWRRDLSYAEILDKESQNLLIYMLQGEIDPHMYHQPNLRAYDGVHTLLGDLLDVAFQKFRRNSTLAVLSPDMQVAGARIANTMGRNASGLTATLTPHTSVTFTSPRGVDFAVSGVCTTGSETYAGKCISAVHVAAGGTVTLPVQ